MAAAADRHSPLTTPAGVTVPPGTLPEILGEVALDPDGVLHGWCWSPARPAERLTLDILVDGRVAASVVASRFREDVRDRKFGDGYHGFTLALTRQLARLEQAGIVAARERASGQVFWQTLRGNFAVPADFAVRVAAMAAGIGGCAGMLPAPAAPDAGAGRMVAAAIGAAGRILAARGGSVPAPPARVTLAYAAATRVTVILDAGDDAERDFATIAAAAKVLAAIQAELLLIDGGADPRCAMLAARVGNLRYFHDTRANPAARRNMAAEYSRGDVLVFLRTTGRRIDLGLTALEEALRTDRLVAGAGIASLARLGAPDATSRLVAAPNCPPLGLDLAVERSLFAALGGFDEGLVAHNAFVAAEFLARALAVQPALVWLEPRAPDDPDADGFQPLL
jgi:hypothetical protein